MIKYPESKARFHITQSGGCFKSIYITMLMLAFQSAITVYIHSTYLEEFVTPEFVGILFMIGAALSIVGLFFVAEPLRRFSNLRFALGLIMLDAIALLAMALLPVSWVVVPCFVLHLALTPLLFFTLDIFLESVSGTEERWTGRRRGITLSIMSLATAFAPLAAGLLAGEGSTPNFTFVYIASALLLAPLAYFLHTRFRNFKDAAYADVQFNEALTTLWNDRNLRYVFSAHFLLQLFFSWTIIYIPLYLATEVGFLWSEIGSILFVGLLAYVLLEYPVGVVSDRYLGEQEMMATGFLILATTTAWLSFIGTAAIVPWMVAMFMTRVGAAFVESTTESYFFKHTRGEDANIIGFFRMTRPLATLMGALLGSVILLFMPFQYMFGCLGLLLLGGIIFATLLDDTC